MKKNEPNPSDSMPLAATLAKDFLRFVETSHAADLAASLVELPRDTVAEQILALDSPRQAKTFSYLLFELQAELVRRLERGDLAKIVP